MATFGANLVKLGVISKDEKLVQPPEATKSPISRLRLWQIWPPLCGKPKSSMYSYFAQLLVRRRRKKLAINLDALGYGFRGNSSPIGTPN